MPEDHPCRSGAAARTTIPSLTGQHTSKDWTSHEKFITRAGHCGRPWSLVHTACQLQLLDTKCISQAKEISLSKGLSTVAVSHKLIREMISKSTKHGTRPMWYKCHPQFNDIAITVDPHSMMQMVCVTYTYQYAKRSKPICIRKRSRHRLQKQLWHEFITHKPWEEPWAIWNGLFVGLHLAMTIRVKAQI